MKRLFSLCAVLALAVLLAASALAAGPEAAGEAYLLMDADTGQVLLGSNLDARENPASITKIMTMALACKKAQGDWSAQLTVSHDAVHSLYGTGSSHIALQEGEVVTLEDMLCAAELVSANDAANVLAEYIGEDGTIAGGVAAMNAQAEALGLQNTHFANPHGITDEAHYTSAYDMGRIVYWALQQPGFEQLFCRTEVYTMQPTNLQPEARAFYLKDYIRIASKKAYVPSVIGSKTGYTDDARYTYVGLAAQDGLRLICVTLHDQLRTEKFSDVKQLLEYGFAQFAKVPVPGGQTQAVPVVGGGAVIGMVRYTAPDQTLLLAGQPDAARVTVSLELPKQLVLGRPALAYAVYTVDGQGAQQDTAVRVPLRPQGLALVVEQSRGAAMQGVQKQKKGLPLWAVAGVAVAVLLLGLAIRGKISGKKTGK